MDTRASGPYKVVKISGLYGQQITIEPKNPDSREKQVVVHSSKLLSYKEPEVDPQEIYIEQFEDDIPQEEETIMQDIPTERKDLMEEPHADPEP